MTIKTVLATTLIGMAALTGCAQHTGSDEVEVQVEGEKSTQHDPDRASPAETVHTQREPSDKKCASTPSGVRFCYSWYGYGEVICGNEGNL